MSPSPGGLPWLLRSHPRFLLLIHQFYCLVFCLLARTDAIPGTQWVLKNIFFLRNKCIRTKFHLVQTVRRSILHVTRGQVRQLQRSLTQPGHGHRLRGLEPCSASHPDPSTPSVGGGVVSPPLFSKARKPFHIPLRDSFSPYTCISLAKTESQVHP